MEEFDNNYYTYENKDPDYEDSKEQTAADIPAEDLNYFSDVKPATNPVFAILSLAFSIASIVLGCFCCCISPVLGLTLWTIAAVAGIVFFVIDKVVNKRTNGMAIAGLIISIISLVLVVISIAVYIIALIIGLGFSFLDSLMYY